MGCSEKAASETLVFLLLCSVPLLQGKRGEGLGWVPERERVCCILLAEDRVCVCVCVFIAKEGGEVRMANASPTSRQGKWQVGLGAAGAGTVFPNGQFGKYIYIEREI